MSTGDGDLGSQVLQSTPTLRRWTTASVSDDDVDVKDVEPLAKRHRAPLGPIGRRAIVSSSELAALVASYRVHFAEWSRLRTVESKQKVPNRVWVLVYADFQKKFPRSHWKEDTLKERLIRTLRELETGEPDFEEKIVLQIEDVREKIVVLEKLKMAEAERAERERPPTNLEMLAEQTKGISAMVTYLTEATGNREEYFSAKAESERRRCSMYIQKARSMRMADLFKLKAAGVYTDEEFSIESKKIMDSS